MGEIQGASKLQILKSITMPLVLPSILSAAIMTVSKSVGSVRRGGESRNAHRLLHACDKDEGIHQCRSACGRICHESILLIVMATGTIFANRLFLGHRRSFETMGGKGTRHTPIPLGMSKYPLLIFIVIFLLVAMVMPSVCALDGNVPKINRYGLSAGQSHALQLDWQT